MSVLRPYKMYSAVTEITSHELDLMGIKALLLDIDGTLMPTKRDRLGTEVIRWIECMKNAGIRLYILSNSRRVRRVEKLGHDLDIPCRALSRKPLPKNFLYAAYQMGLPPEEIAMVGDQIFTDTLGANLAGIRALLVESTDTDLWYQPLRRVLELPFMRETCDNA